MTQLALPIPLDREAKDELSRAQLVASSSGPFATPFLRSSQRHQAPNRPQPRPNSWPSASTSAQPLSSLLSRARHAEVPPACHSRARYVQGRGATALAWPRRPTRQPRCGQGSRGRRFPPVNSVFPFLSPYRSSVSIPTSLLPSERRAHAITGRPRPRPMRVIPLPRP